MEFEEFARAEWAALRRTAFWLSGNWHTAEDLAQATLIKVYARWWTLRRPARAAAFARSTLARTWIDWQRKRSTGEVPAEYVADRAAEESDVPLRHALLTALESLPAVQRAVVVLRYWEDLPVDEVARLLGRKPATVRSDAARGLAALRETLEERGALR
ncbi:SigE family RNA polymerase sigma factor [Actinacidiphila acidipaludis]|uniref:SigE family RNA polymerase sigma factor n=1 Tax=Actinacidiphila acidipaludis TaxID=2873382 RepID=A0ABS7QGA7_9ACTN|nr:SigE family RNA polymerase sigma factor [Streptomyces acidipaludis]MBY8882204.1 SigE family RNA polymerase sigma factor [Streptomyces acidipaludis]